MSEVNPLDIFKSVGKLTFEEITTTSGKVITIVFIGHGSIAFVYENFVIYLDPWLSMGKYRQFPKADVILITHEHIDHLDEKAIGVVRKDSTVVYVNASTEKKMKDKSKVTVLAPSSHVDVIPNISFDTVPAYNTTEKNKFRHPKERGDLGFIVAFETTRIYVPGDTEPIPEYSTPVFENLAAAFVPVWPGPTMTPEQAAETARTLKVPILYPYHCTIDMANKVAELLKDDPVTRVTVKPLEANVVLAVLTYWFR